MKNILHKSLLIALCTITVVSCKPKAEEFPAPSAGPVDFSRFVAIGDGTAGGYANGSLNREAQLQAFPALLAEQFKLVGGAETFHQPLVEAGKSYGFENGLPFTTLDLHYVTFCDGKTELFPEEIDSISLIDIALFKIKEPGPYNNLGAQGTKMIYANKKSTWTVAFGGSDTYWTKISSSGDATVSMVDDAVAQNPTFVSINLGLVDVMRNAKSGGDQDGGDDDFITSFPRFRDSLYSIMNRLTKNNTNGLKGCINNLIDLNSYPYVTYIKYDGLILTQTQADELNSFYSADGFSFHVGRNAYVIDDEAATNGRRRIVEGEFILFEIPQDSLRCYDVGGKLPIRKRWTLVADEVELIQTAIEGYNSILKTAANAYNFALADGNAYMKLAKEETHYQGIPLNTDFITGNQFTLDGLNIGPLSHMLFANSIIGEINIKYGSTIPLINVTTTPAVQFH